MKLVRYKKNGNIYPGIISKNNTIHDLSYYIEDISGDALSHSILSEISRISIYDMPVVSSHDGLDSCVGKVDKIICIGLNYLDHIHESNADIPNEPVIFSKLCSTTGAYDDIMLPKNSKYTDWEVELAVVIGKKCQYISRKESINYIAGYCIINDFSERKFQLEHGGQWVKGKSYQGFAPLGPWLVTKDEIQDVQNLNTYTKVGKNLYQVSNTKQMIFQVDYLISYLSKFMTLYPGDVVSTGTPPGVGLGIKPKPIYLKEDQRIIIGIDGLGEQKYSTIAYKKYK